MRLIPARRDPTIDVEALVRFAVSVFWRASFHVWRIGDYLLSIDLGKQYNEQLRRFLLGIADLPENVVIYVAVSDATTAELTWFAPGHEKYEHVHRFEFAIPGVMFYLSVGGRMPEIMKVCCTYRSAEHYIYYGPKITDAIMRVMAGLVSVTRPSRRLLQQ